MTCLMNVVIWVIGENVLEQWLLRAYKWQPFISAAIGLVPNCVSSILITQLYLEGMISLEQLSRDSVQGQEQVY